MIQFCVGPSIQSQSKSFVLKAIESDELDRLAHSAAKHG